MPTDAEIKSMAAREIFEREFRRHIRPEHGQTMRDMQRVVRETQALREAAARPKPTPQPQPASLGEAIANIGNQPAIEPQPEPAEEPPLPTLDDAIRELRAADRRR